MAAGSLLAADPFLWNTGFPPANVPPLMANAVQPSEFEFSAHNMGMVFH